MQLLRILSPWATPNSTDETPFVGKVNPDLCFRIAAAGMIVAGFRDPIHRMNPGAVPSIFFENMNTTKFATKSLLMELAGMAWDGLKAVAWEHWSFVKDARYLLQDRKLEDPEARRINTAINLRALIEGGTATAAGALLVMPIVASIAIKTLVILGVTSPWVMVPVGLVAGLTVASWIGNRFSNEVHEKQVEQYAMKYITPEAPEVPVPPHEQGAWFKEAYSTGDAKGKQWVGNGMLQRESSTTSTKQAHRTAGQETNACIDLNTYDLGEKVRPDSVEKDNIT